MAAVCSDMVLVIFCVCVLVVAVLETTVRALYMLGKDSAMDSSCRPKSTASFYIKQHLWGQSKRAFILSCRLSGIH